MGMYKDGEWLDDADIIAYYGEPDWRPRRRYRCADRMCGADDCVNCRGDAAGEDAGDE